MGVHASAYTAGLLCRRCWASTTSPPACLRRRRVVPPPTRLAYYAAAVGRLRLHRRPASVAAEWCLRLHGWPIMPPLLGVYDFTAGLPPSPPIGASAYTAGLLCRRCWASTTSPPACLRRRRLVPPPTRLAYYAAAVGRLRLHRRPASVAAEWCLRLHGWPIMPPLLGVYDFTAGLPPSPPIGDFTAGLPPSPPIGASAYTAGLLCRRCWASTTSPPACLRRRRVVPPPTRLAYYAAAVGRLRLHRRPASVAADWCLRLHGWPIMPPLLGVYDFTAGLPPSPPIGASAYTAGLLCRRCWASTTSPPACLRRRRLVFPPARLAFMPPLLGVYVFTDRLAFAAADWCFRLHGWPLCRRCWASTSSPTSRLVRRRLVLPPARLAFMPPLLGVYVFTDWLAFAAADWCFRLHGWPLCRHCWASTSSPTGLPSPPPTGVSACTAGLYAAVVGRLRLHRPACLRRRRLVFPPARLAFMPPLLGVYVFTDRPPRPPPTGASACTAGLYAAVVGRLRLHRLACLRRCRLVFPPARLAFMPPLLGVYVFTDRLAFAAADWCFRLHGWPLCRRCWASTSSPTGRLVRRRLVLPPARLAYYAAVVGRLRLHRPAASSAADWCFRLHGWPLCRRCWASTSSPTGLPSPPPTGVSACTAGLYAAVVGRLRLHRPAASSAADWCFRLHGWPIMPPLLGVYVFTDRLAFAAADWCFRLHGWPLCRRCWACTSSPTGRLVRRRLVLPPARLAYYAAVVGRLRRHRPATSTAADWCFRLHGWPIMLPLLGVYVFTGRPPHPPLTDVTASTAGLL
uniref:cysteine dioxygenase n=1 Tax=Oryza sativa subsp. japonica TaxID=39947 RepID=Q7XWK7_ORYSJ|nr:OSJNBa0052O21.9 [Oryza sativa Japonica Group]